MSRPVSEILLKKYGIEVEPGKKTVCPECKHRTLSLKRDDTLAKCFHPECGKWIATWSKGDKESPMSILLMTLYNDFHKVLLERQTPESQNAYKYLTEERRVHEKVIEHSLIGVVPKGYRINDKIKRLTEPQARDYTDDGPYDQPHESITNLKETIKKAKGWIALFYTDEYHRITSIKLRRPYSIDFMMFKPTNGKTGLFGLGLFTARDHGNNPDLDRELIVVEGEFNQLQLQSLMARHNESRGSLPEHGYVNAVAVGGVSGADIDVISKISRNPYIFYDNDDAGLMLIKKAQERMSLWAATTLEAGSDLDSYIRSFAGDYQSAADGIKRLIGEARRYNRNIEMAQTAIRNIRRNENQSKKLKSHEQNEMIAKQVIEDLLERGKLYKDQNDRYYFNQEIRTLFLLDLKGEDLKLMLSDYSINPSENLFKYVCEELNIKATREGEITEVHKHCYFDPTNYVLYLYNGNNQIFKITEDDICDVDNGTDGVLFLDDRSYEPFELVRYSMNESLLDKLILSRIVFAEDRLTFTERKILICIWFYSLFFESIMPTKPILAFIGEKGSGKSLTAKLIVRTLFGPKSQVVQPPEKADDFDTILTNSYVVAIDNADSNQKWLPDKLAIAATGGAVQKRKLYHDNRLLSYPIRCFVVITSRTPQFNRDDVAERMIIMKLDRIIDVKGDEEREYDLLEDIDKNRNQIMSEIVHNIQRILAVLKAEKNSKHKLRLRMADYADFMLRIANQAGIKRIAEDIIEQLASIQSDFPLEDDMLPDLIDVLLSRNGNEGKEFSTLELFESLKKIANERDIVFPFKSSVSFGRKMKQIRSNLAENYEINRQIRGGGRVFWTLKRQNQA